MYFQFLCNQKRKETAHKKNILSETVDIRDDSNKTKVVNLPVQLTH